MFRALESEPLFCLGIDPMPLAYFQFLAMHRYVAQNNMAFLLRGMEDVNVFNGQFDTVMSMGVLYHRRDPEVALKRMADLLTPSGTLLLETLIIPGNGDRFIRPVDRYAAMPNVHELPTLDRLMTQLKRVGFTGELVHQGYTSLEEQRATSWSTPESLKDFLDPHDSLMTREGYPAPLRAIVICER